MDLPSIERFKVVKQRERTARQLAIDAVIETITDQKDLKTGKPWTYSRWCKKLEGIPPFEINSMLASAKNSKNVGAKFNYLIKQYKHEKTTNNN